MAGYLSAAVKLVLNVHDLNNEGSIGQSLDIRQIKMVDEAGTPLEEMPAVSGRMMKHWHLEYMLKDELNQSSPQLCEQCKVFEPERQPSEESEGVKKCVICDTHGFLCAKSSGTNAKGSSLRRSSCVNFSWLLPVLEKDENNKLLTPVAKQVIHSRVASGGAEREEKSSQMIFHKSYASGVYAFVCTIDLNRIGKPLKGEGISDPDERKRRQELAIQTLLPLCVGAFGASQSHALPHTRCLGLVVALSSTNKPIPNLISPIYPKGFEESITLLKSLGSDVDWWTYGEGLEGAKDTVQQVFEEILKKIRE